MIIGIVGSRRRNSISDRQLIAIQLDILNIFGNSSIKLVSGGCTKGADSFVPWLAEFFKVNYYEHLPKLPENFNRLQGIQRKWAYAKAAYARNTLIAQDSDILVACVAPDRTGGTEDTIKKFKKIHRGTKKLILC